MNKINNAVCLLLGRYLPNNTYSDYSQNPIVNIVFIGCFSQLLIYFP